MTHKILLKMVEYNGNDVRRINHALKVYGFASAICRAEILNDTEIEIIEAAAILHDIGIHEAERKYNSSGGKYQEIEGPPIARKMLENMGMNETTIERICYIIAHHHTYSKIDGIDFQIVVEADFLVNIFEDNIDKTDTIGLKYFKTDTGKKFLNSMYGTKLKIR